MGGTGEPWKGLGLERVTVKSASWKDHSGCHVEGGLWDKKGMGGQGQVLGNARQHRWRRGGGHLASLALRGLGLSL